MTKEAALHNFFNSFGIPGYTTSSVPDDAVFPWLTYELVTGSIDNGENSLTANLWYYGESEAVPNAKAREIAEEIGYSGKVLTVDGGFIWIKRGTPWCQNLRDETNANIKRRYLNITVEYLTLN
jgi:hypothetical protein